MNDGGGLSSEDIMKKGSKTQVFLPFSLSFRFLFVILHNQSCILASSALDLHLICSEINSKNEDGITELYKNNKGE